MTRSWSGLLVVASFVFGFGNIFEAVRAQSGAVAASGAALAPTSGGASGVAQRRASHLRHGINLSEWFQAGGDPNGLTKQHRWNATRIDNEIAQAADWSAHWGVPIICNEFGVYRKNADAKDRAAWILDVRTSLEKHGIGWAMWDYDGGFGVVTRENGHAAADELTVQALGRAMLVH